MKRFMKRLHRGEGLHHVCFKVYDIYSAMKELAAKGIELMNIA
jgi:4-hydroxyphenylpyruvate dioxygenase-like putative hemolysin